METVLKMILKPKKISFLLAIIWGFILTSNNLVNAQSLEIIEEVGIRETIGRQLEAWNKGNINGFMMGYWQHDSLRFISSKGIKKGWNTVLEMYQKSYPTREDMGKLTFETSQIRSLGTANGISRALVIGKWFVVKKDVHNQEVKQNGNFSLIFQKIDGKWLIVSDHTN